MFFILWYANISDFEMRENITLIITLFSVSDTLRHLLIICVIFQNTEEAEIFKNINLVK